MLARLSTCYFSYSPVVSGYVPETVKEVFYGSKSDQSMFVKYSVFSQNKVFPFPSSS